MLAKPDEVVLKALARLGKDADWEILEAWLAKSAEDCAKASCCESDARSRQEQGAYMVIGDLIRNTKTAVELSTRR